MTGVSWASLFPGGPLGELRRCGGLPVDGRFFGKPRYARADGGAALQNPFWPMGLHRGERAQQRVRALESKWAVDERFWQRANSLRFDSWSEKNLAVQVVLEVDGPKYHGDAEAERRRDEELGVPVVHVHPDLLQQEDGLGEVLELVWEKLGWAV